MLLLHPEFDCVVPLQFTEELNCVEQSHESHFSQLENPIEIRLIIKIKNNFFISQIYTKDFSSPKILVEN